MNRRGNPEKPNIVLFLTDDLGYGDLPSYGNKINRTPNLDRFAAQGMRFTDCHSAGTVCAPSRAAILTGRTPFRIGFYDIIGKGKDLHLRKEEIGVASLLRSAGYDTCFVGKWHVSWLEDPAMPNPGDHGFDHWFATSINGFARNEGPANPSRFYRNGVPVGQVQHWYCDAIVEEASRWLVNRPQRDRRLGGSAVGCCRGNIGSLFKIPQIQGSQACDTR